MTTLTTLMDENGQVLQDECGAAIFPYWSFTKSVLAALVLRRAEEIGTDLDAPLENAPYSLRQLMSHRAGLVDYGPLPEYKAAVARNDPPWSENELWVRAKADDFFAPPGQSWRYSNLGYLRLRQWLETSYGCPLAEIFQAEIAKPHGFDTHIALTAEDFTRLSWDFKGYHPGWVYHGCLVGRADQAIRLLELLVKGDFLSESQRAAMLENHLVGGPIEGRIWQKTGYGLGLMIGNVQGLGQVIGHTGCGPESGNLIAYFPDLPKPVFGASFHHGGSEVPAEHALVAAVRTNS